ncbi:PAPLN [Mytilus edulis]|uniref:PAPLN n=1 Tax=Mytilus edulis TaxID=6550 RepID=A0A8S3RZ76_MYTED|nr:PAPLN [Mytilus edulis]
MLRGPLIVIFIFFASTAEAPPPVNVCDLPKVVGTCNARIKRFHYDVHSGTCGEFYYNGCDGNKNNFRTKEECKTVCNKRAEAQQSDNLCDLPKVAGPCNARIKRFYFDVNSGICGEFYYGGCDDNENNFKTIEECKTVCNKRICTLPHVRGPGGVAIQRWFYNSDTMKCETFSYSGSNGSKNNFKTKTECEGLCDGVKKDPCGPLPSCPRPPFGSCFGFTYNIINGVKCISGCSFGCPQKPCPKDPLESCISCIPEIGDKCSGDKICCSGCCRDPVIGRMHIGKPLAFLIYITLQISDAQLVDNVCDLKKDVGPCNARMSRYHYDVDSGECKQFFYGGCDGNENNFKTKQECFTDCEKRVCTLVVHYGSGGAKIKRWFYNSETMKCETFIYGGSYGNKNSFKKKRSCKKLCKGVERDPCGNIPPCIRPQPNECSDFTYDIINGVECIVGCFNSRCKQGSCPTSPFPVCTSECLLDSECAGNKLCCSGCCRSPILDNKPGTCPTDPGQQQCYGRTSECEKDSQCDGKRKCCKFSSQTQATPSFYALDNPCYDKFKLCSSSCEVVTLKNDVIHIMFNSFSGLFIVVLWPTTVSTVPTTIPPTITTSGTRSPYITVNNITYVTLRNPCQQKLAMCPTFCDKSNVSYHGRICETCECKVLQKESFGKFC